MNGLLFKYCVILIQSSQFIFIMSNFGHNDQDDRYPPLNPIKKKKVEQAPLISPSEKSNIDPFNNFLNLMGKPSKNNEGAAQAEEPQKNKKKQPNESKIAEFDKNNKDKIPTVQKKEQSANRQIEKSKQNEKSKFLIAEMLNKISVKNLTEELYPVSNEVIENLISKIQQEIDDLKYEAEKKESTLAVNPNNLSLKKQLETMRKEIGHCSTIKELYYEKINYRNKIKILEGQIIDLRTENRDLKLKVSRGIETIQNYKQNLPSDLEKELQDKLTKCTQKLESQKEMRQNLQKNIENIIMNFKRLYEQADAARLIVTNKLREVQERERVLNKARQVSDDNESDYEGPPTRRVTSLEMAEDKRQVSGSFNDSFINDTQGGNTVTNHRKGYDQEPTHKKPSNSLKQKSYAGKTDEGKDTKKNGDNQKMSLQQKIQKMRNNAYILSRANQSK